jgi:hypothetical protein
LSNPAVFAEDPLSTSLEFGKEVRELAKSNACTAPNTARTRRFKLLRDLIGLEKRISRVLCPDELIEAFDEWYSTSQPYLDPKKGRDDYLAKFLGEHGNVRVPTGEGETLKKALDHVVALSVSSLPLLPGITKAPERWQRLAALHCELARQSPNGIYFLSCRDAAKAHPGLNKDSALSVNRALVKLGVIESVRVGDARPGGKASRYRYRLLSNTKQGAHILPSQWQGDPGDARLRERQKA